MAISVQISQPAPVFHGQTAPEPGTVSGYAAIIHHFALPVPMPDQISLISEHNRKYQQQGWQVFGQRYHPEDTLYSHLSFAFRYEGIQLLALKKLFEQLTQQDVIDLIKIRPNGQYSRKIWFLYEWLMQEGLPIPDADVKTGYIPLLDEKLQFGMNNGIRSTRHRIINNLPGNPDFCPLVFKTQKLISPIALSSSQQAHQILNRFSKDLLQRASSFLLLKDSKASFTIEGESPKNSRAVRWGKAIGQAGKYPLTKAELIRLQQIVISDQRFVKPGFREKGGFVGEHDRDTGMPIPDHISAKPDDLEQLIQGLIDANQKLEGDAFDPVVAATMVAFGLVFIHPFQDGNGRIHRYLIHHVLARRGYTKQGLVFPVSASILDQIDDYRKALQYYSLPLLDFIEWKVTPDNNVEVLNDTIDYYRYFDATPQAELLFDRVQDTVDRIIPEEVRYLHQYDQFKQFMDSHFDMADSQVALLFRFLEQNEGTLSKRAKQKEFAALSEQEIIKVEQHFQAIIG
jgi:Fic family protein